MALSQALYTAITPKTVNEYVTENQQLASDRALRVAQLQAAQMQVQSGQEEAANKRRGMAISMLNGIASEQDPAKQAQLYSTLKPMVERYDTTLKLPDAYDPSLTKALTMSQISPEKQFEAQLTMQKAQTMTPYQQAQIDALNERNAIQREKMSAASSGKALSMPAMKDLEGKAKGYEDMTRLATGFKDEYGGNTVTGGLENFLGRMGGENVGLTSPGQTQWWQDYQGYVNQVRNDLFGAALTATEKAEFEKAIVTPGMDPKQARANLARQQALTQKGLVRAGSVYKKGGYNADQIGEYVPAGLENIDTSSPALDGGATGPKPGAVVNGFVFMGGNPNDKNSWKAAR